MGTAIERPSNTEYMQSIAAYWENSPKIIKIILLQFYFKFSDGNFFFQNMIFTIFSKYLLMEKIVIDENAHNKITKSHQVPCFHDI